MPAIVNYSGGETEITPKQTDALSFLPEFRSHQRKELAQVCDTSAPKSQTE